MTTSYLRVSGQSALRRVAGAAAAILLVSLPAGAQARGAAAIGQAVDGLSVSARVLVIGAHPDDEDTQLITWLATGRHVETAYLSLTRGDGGQNLLGNELGEALGAIRTQELLAARRIDGGRQYFARAYDFGFSKNAQESFTQWPHDSLLRDVITVIRAFRPHVIVSVFSGTPRDGHGQHQVAGILAREAYDAAGDTVRFPRSTTAGLGGWTVLKFYRGGGFRGEPASLRVNVGEYNPLLGRSYSEIASDSRSQHKSQAFGQLQRKGVRWDAVLREATRVDAPANPDDERTLFDGIDTTWARFRDQVASPAARAALDSLPAAFLAARRKLDVFAPATDVAALARVRRLLDRVCLDGSGANACVDASRRDAAGRPLARRGDLDRAVEIAGGRVNHALALATGVAIEATAPREVWGTGEEIPVGVAVYDRGTLPIGLDAIAAMGSGPGAVADLRHGFTLAPDSVHEESLKVTINDPTQPWWLVTPRHGAMFTPPILGVEESTRRPPASVTATFAVDSARFTVMVPVVYRYADPLKGERDDPIAGAPAVSVLLDNDVAYAPANAPIERPVRVHLKSAASGSRDADVTLRVPVGLTVDTATRHVTLPAPGAVRTISFNVRGTLPPGRHVIEAVATSGGERFASGYVAVAYDHIRTQRLYRPSRLTLEAVDLRRPAAMHIAYIAGVGDNVEPALEQLGLDVVLLDPAQIPRTDLSKFTAVVVGTRAYEASPTLVANNARLLEYVQHGGTMVVQYGQYEMAQPGMMPYPITLARPADRVTVENGPVHITDPSAAVLTTPNRIGEDDFSGWIQDRTLYMPRTMDPHYQTMLEVNDPGEPPNKGAIMIAPYGSGTYVYTTLAFFRQLPNGVPGAARLFANLLAAKAGRTVQ